MEKELKELETAIERVELEKLTPIAQNIASIALGSFSGELLTRALDISKAIVEYEVELKHAQARA